MADPSKDINKDGVIKVIDVTNDEDIDKTVDQQPLLRSIKGPLSLKLAGSAYVVSLSVPFPRIPVFFSGTDDNGDRLPGVNWGAVNRNKFVLASGKDRQPSPRHRRG